METPYRGLSIVPPCFCRAYPPGTIFRGWEIGEVSPSIVNKLLNRTLWKHTLDKLDKLFPTQTHTAQCLRERKCSSRELQEVKFWHWKTSPLFRCFFLQHRYQVIVCVPDIKIEVCQCGAERATDMHDFIPCYRDTHGRYRQNLFAAYQR